MSPLPSRKDDDRRSEKAWIGVIELVEPRGLEPLTS